MRETFRPFSRRELNLLRSNGPLTGLCLLALILSIFALGLYYLFVWIQARMLHEVRFPYAVWIAVLIPSMLFLLSLRAHFRFARQLSADIRSGSVRLRTFQAHSAVEFKEREDEGPVIVINCADETVVFWGQELDRLVERGFPWTDFEVIEAPETGLCFRIRKLGPPLADVERLATLSYADSKGLAGPARRYAILDNQGLHKWRKILQAYREPRSADANNPN